MRHRHRVVAEVRQPQVAQQEAAVGVGIGAHATLPGGSQFRKLGNEPARLVEQFVRPIASQPLLQEPHVARSDHVADRDLMRAKSAFDLLPVHRLRAGPTLWRAQNDHGPARTLREPLRTSIALDAANLGDDGVERCRHLLVHVHRVIALDDIGHVPVAVEERR